MFQNILVPLDGSELSEKAADISLDLALRLGARIPGFVAELDTASPDLDRVVEEGKKTFAGYELNGQTLGIVGLGKIGCLVAEAAIGLGMQVMGYDPDISIDAAWSLPSQVRRASSVNELLRQAQFVTLHVPLVDATRNLVHEGNIGLMQPGAVLLNFSRDGVVANAAVLEALEADQLGGYVCDFPSAELHLSLIHI